MGFGALGALCSHDEDLDTAFNLLSSEDLKILNREDVRSLWGLRVLDDPEFATHFPTQLINELQAQLIRHVFEGRLAHKPLDGEFLQDANFGLCVKTVPGYARRLFIESLPFLSKRTRNCLRRNNIRRIPDLEGLTDSDLLKFDNFGVGCLQNIKAALLSVPESLDIATIVNTCVEDVASPEGSTEVESSVLGDDAMSIAGGKESIDSRSNESARATAIDIERPLAVASTLRLTEFVNRNSSLQDERRRGIIFSRLGYDGPPLILEQVGAKYGVTRERVRQIVRKFGKKLDGIAWVVETNERLTRLLVNRREPLFLDMVEAEDSWFEGVGVHARFYAAVLRLSASFHLNVLEIDNRTVISNISEPDWESAAEGAREALGALSSVPIRRSDVRLICESRLLKFSAAELADVLLEAVDANLIYSDADDADPVLLSTDSKMTSLIRVIVDESTTSLTLEGLQKRLVEFGQRERSLGYIRNVLAPLDYHQIGGGRYATFSKLWPEWTETLQEACDAVELVCDERPTRQFHASELYDLLEEVDATLPERIASYQELNILLLKKSTLKYLSRYVWQSAEAKARSPRIDIQQALLRIVEEAGHPLTNEVLFQRLREYRGMSRFSMIIATPEFLRTAPKTWGLFPRDFPLDHEGLQALLSTAREILDADVSPTDSSFFATMRTRRPAETKCLDDFMIGSLLTANRVIRRDSSRYEAVVVAGVGESRTAS